MAHILYDLWRGINVLRQEMNINIIRYVGKYPESEMYSLIKSPFHFITKVSKGWDINSHDWFNKPKVTKQVNPSAHQPKNIGSGNTQDFKFLVSCAEVGEREVAFSRWH